MLKCLNRHKSKSIWVTIMSFGQNDSLMGGSLWQKDRMHSSRKSKISWRCLQVQSKSNSLSVFTFYSTVLKKPCVVARCTHFAIVDNLTSKNGCIIIGSPSWGVKQKLVSIFHSLFHLIMAVPDQSPYVQVMQRAIFFSETQNSMIAFCRFWPRKYTLQQKFAVFSLLCYSMF